jgi:hypothetical protein
MLGNGLYSSRPILFSNEKLLHSHSCFIQRNFYLGKASAWVLVLGTTPSTRKLCVPSAKFESHYSLLVFVF